MAQPRGIGWPWEVLEPTHEAFIGLEHKVPTFLRAQEGALPQLRPTNVPQVPPNRRT